MLIIKPSISLLGYRNSGGDMKIGQVLRESGGFGKGFDFLRIALATGIIGWHSGTLTGHGEAARSTPLWMVEYSLVPMFFMLSGFLVAGSGSRLSLKNFMLNRSVRIVPALAMDVIFAALLLGPMLTTVSLSEYFTDRTFFSYFANIFGWIHFLLPGVFKDNPTINVNGALWTVPYEIGCYILFGILMVTGSIRRPVRIAAVTVGLLVCSIIAQEWGFLDTSDRREDLMSTLVSFVFIEKGARLLPSFLIGVVFYYFKDRIIFDWRIAAAILVGFVITAFTGSITQFFSTWFHALALPSLAYLTVFIGLLPIRNPWPFSKGDYSYGLYLYHAPFMQALIVVFPWLLVGKNWMFLFPIAFPLCLAVAWVSWHFIEKPTLAVRKRFSFAEQHRAKQEAEHRLAEANSVSDVPAVGDCTAALRISG